MGFNCGIVGLPNVGKSTIFNALTKTSAADVANYPFCTIEPNTGRVAVPDTRLNKIATLAKSAQLIPTFLEFVDIAGLVKGAAHGEGLGNQFLGNIREVDAIAHVLRCFETTDITHVEDTIDPLRDSEIIETELMLADLESLEKRLAALTKKAHGGDKQSKSDLTLMEKLLDCLAKGMPIRNATNLNDDERERLSQLQLLTSKPILYVCNVGEDHLSNGNSLSEQIAKKAAHEGAAHVIISAAIEAEIASLDDEDATEFMNDLGLSSSGLGRMIKAGYDLLDLITFFTAGEKETRAWTVHSKATAPEAAGVIHSDFQRGFIRAETISFDDYISCGGEVGARASGKMRQEGASYQAQDGDIFHFRFNVS